VAKLVTSHYMANFPIAINDNPIPNDYYSTSLINPRGESDKHIAYGGYGRDAMAEVEGLVRPRGGDFKLEDMKIDVARGKAAGLDAFTIDIQSFSAADGRWTNTLKLLEAATLDGTFKIIVCPDMNVLTKPYDNAAFATALAQMAGYSSALRDASNRLVVSPFLAGGLYSSTTGGTYYTAGWWQTTFQECHNRGFAIALIPKINGTGIPTTAMDLYDSLTLTSSGLTSSTYGYAPWGGRDTTTSVNSVAAATTMRGRAGNASKVWVHPVAAYDHRPSTTATREHEGTKLLRNTWNDAITAGTGSNDMVECITWNDVKESPWLSPTRRNRSGGSLQAFGYINKRYSTRFKSGAFPALTEDSVHITHRNQLAAPQLRLSSAITAGAARTTLPIVAIPVGGFRPTVNTKLHTTLGEVVTVAAQPAEGATSLSIQSWTPANAYAANTAFIQPIWTYVPPTGNYKPMVNTRWTSEATATDTVNTVEILTYLTPTGGDARVTVTIGGVAQAPYTISDGTAEHVQVFAAANGVAPSVVVERPVGTTILTLTSPEAISAAPYVQDYQPVTATAVSTAAPPPPPEILVTTRIRLAHDTAANWTAENPVLLRAEQAWDVTALGVPTGRFKVGDGVTGYNSLPFFDELVGMVRQAAEMNAILEDWPDGETVPSIGRMLSSVSNVGSTSQTLRLVFFTARKSQTITQVRVPAGATAAAGLTLCRLGVWSVDTAGAGTLIASTPNDTALLIAATTEYTKAFSASWNKVAGQRYAVGLLQVGTTVASLIGATSNGGNGTRATRFPRVGGLWTAQADLPASFTNANLGATSTWFNCDLLL
jgi:hypothetical protein